MAVATMTSKGQLTVPKEIRDRLGLKPGDKVELTPSGEQAVTMMPNSSRNSRISASRTLSPGSTLPPGNSQ